MVDDITTLLEDAADDGDGTADASFDRLWDRGRTRRRRTQLATAAAAVVGLVAVAGVATAALDRGPAVEVVGVPTSTQSARPPATVAPTTDGTVPPTDVPSPTPSPSTPPTSAASPSDTPTSDRSGPDATDGPAAVVRDDLGWFRTPSGNISCWFYDDEWESPASAHCRIQEYDYDPVYTSWFDDICELDWGNILETSALGVGFVCHSDVYYLGVDGRVDWDPGTWPIAEYGTTVRHEDVTCLVEETGVTCTSPGGEFSVARTAYSFTPRDELG